MGSLLLDILIYATSAGLVVWMAGAIYYDVGRATAVGGGLSLAWILLAVFAFLTLDPLWQPFGLLLLAFAIFYRWWRSQQPSHDRNWDPQFARLPRIELQGDLVRIENVRNSRYGKNRGVTPHFETREYHFSNLSGLDALLVTWGSRWMSHPMFVFDFGSDGRVCVSIEVRYRVGQEYNLLRSLYRQQELMYVVSDERDAILRRTHLMEGHDVYLYRMHITAIRMRQLFLEYAGSINLLRTTPRWYHGLLTNCTTSIYQQGRGHIQWDWRMLVNGELDRLMYERELLDQSMPFEPLKEQSRINDVVERAPEHDFGNSLRRELPGYLQQ